MISDEEIESALYGILTGSKLIGYDKAGLKYIVDELGKIYPPNKVVFSFQNIEEMSVQDRIERKLPKIYVNYL